MHGSSTYDLETAGARHAWSDHNERGLAFASEGAWEEATSAFAGAADSVSADADVASHEALALVLNNLAHSCFRSGQVEDAIRHAQRVCALRVALVGEDAMAVARARTDLAVMLASTGRAEEGMTLISRAIAGIERSAGDEDLHLSFVLENAARLAMSAGQPATAEPYLLRLHALLAEHDLPTDRADALLARVSEHRATARHAFGLPTAAEVRVDDVRNEADVIEEASADDVRSEADVIEEAPADDVRNELVLIEEVPDEDVRNELVLIEEVPDEDVRNEAGRCRGAARRRHAE